MMKLTCCCLTTYLCLRLGGFGVVPPAETKVGQFHTDRTCRSRHKHVNKSCPWWYLNPQPPNYVAHALPVEPR